MPLKTGAELQALGHEAASTWAGGRHNTLNQAVVASVKEAGLNREQVQRVVESANKQAFAIEHAKEAEHRYVEFSGGPARTDEVLRHLNDSPEPVTYHSLSDYAHAPAKTAAQRERDDARLFEGFPEEAPIPLGVVVEEEMSKLRKMASSLRHDLQELDGMLSFADSEVDYTTRQLIHQMKTAHAQGASLGEIVHAWSSLNPDPVYVKEAFARATGDLLATGRFPGEEFERSLSKIASVGQLPDLEHPAVQAFGAFCAALDKKAACQHVGAELESGINHLETVIRETKTAAADGRGLISKGRDAVNWAAQHGGAAAHAIAKPLFDAGSKHPETVKSVVSGGIKAIPALGAAAVGLKGLQHARAALNSPMGEFAKSFVPGTDAHLRDQYETQAMYGGGQYY